MCMNYPAPDKSTGTSMQQQVSQWKQHGSKQTKQVFCYITNGNSNNSHEVFPRVGQNIKRTYETEQAVTTIKKANRRRNRYMHGLFMQTWAWKISVNIEDMKHIMYTDQTWWFPVMSSQGNRHIMELWDTNGNLILVKPMKDKTSGEMCKAYKKSCKGWTKLESKLESTFSTMKHQITS